MYVYAMRGCSDVIVTARKVQGCVPMVYCVHGLSFLRVVCVRSDIAIGLYNGNTNTCMVLSVCVRHYTIVCMIDSHYYIG